MSNSTNGNEKDQRERFSLVGEKVAMAAQVITLDGPAASGKSSVSRELARRHGWNWVSTGAFYRGLARVARLEKIPLNDEIALSILAREPFWQVLLELESTRVVYRDQDITQEIFSEENGQDASLISQLGGVRKALLDAQRACATRGQFLIAEGRDCGSVVFPGAALKFYLTADASDRAQRRALEKGASAEQIGQAQKVRDSQDANRKESPMAVADDAQVIDTTGMALVDVIEMVDRIIIERLKI